MQPRLMADTSIPLAPSARCGRRLLAMSFLQSCGVTLPACVMAFADPDCRGVIRPALGAQALAHQPRHRIAGPLSREPGEQVGGLGAVGLAQPEGGAITLAPLGGRVLRPWFVHDER